MVKRLDKSSRWLRTWWTRQGERDPHARSRCPSKTELSALNLKQYILTPLSSVFSSHQTKSNKAASKTNHTYWLRPCWPELQVTRFLGSSSLHGLEGRRMSTWDLLRNGRKSWCCCCSLKQVHRAPKLMMERVSHWQTWCVQEKIARHWRWNVLDGHWRDCFKVLLGGFFSRITFCVLLSFCAMLLTDCQTQCLCMDNTMLRSPNGGTGWQNLGCFEACHVPSFCSL